jgi:CoA:oxalate CoA-transferase
VKALLDGVRVVDLSRVLAGPFAAQVLGELGADVIKVEPPSGDPARTIGPHIGGRSMYFSSLNTHKRSVVLDLLTDPGRFGLRCLLDTSDVLVENLRPEAARRMDCDPETLLAEHPHLVVVTVSSYSSRSLLANKGSLDVTAQAEPGLMSVTGEPDSAPVPGGVPIADFAAGLWAALAAVGGIAARHSHGKGRHIEVPLLDAALTSLTYMATAAMATGIDPIPVGSGHHNIVPYGASPWMAEDSVFSAAQLDVHH